MPPRLLLVHAHPDDESLTCATTMAHHVARGDEVHVLTCTLGEEGEVIPADLAHLEAHPDDLLAEHRRGELQAALRALGATGHLLGEGEVGSRHYRDSGMAGSAAAARPDALVNADLEVAGLAVAQLVRRLGPDALVTYDAQGGYGHPDHIQTHRLVRAALARLADNELPRRTFEILTPLSWAHEDRAWLREAGPAAYGMEGDPTTTARRLTVPRVDDPFPPSVVEDSRVTHAVEDPATRGTKLAAYRAHATQVLVVSDDVHALSNLIARRTTDREGFGRVDPRTWRPLPADGPGEALTG